MCQQVTHAVHLLKAQICILPVQGSSDSCSSPRVGPLKVPGYSGIIAPTARGKPVASIHSAEPNRIPGFPQAPPLRARPRGSARSRPARHLGYSVRLERLLATVVRVKSQGMGDSELGKGDACCLGSGPRSGSRPSTHEQSEQLSVGVLTREFPSGPVQASLLC